jgi:hypothetical protein
MKTKGTEDPDQTHAATAIWILTKEPKTCVREKSASSTNDAEKTVHLPVED